MEDVNISKYRASVVREGSKPASPGFVVSEGQSPTDPAGSGQNHLPVTIAAASTGLSITESQILSGAGTVAQYIRGDGSLADFPEASGGGSSISYYLNGSISQGTIGGVAYKELNKVPVLGAGTDFSINADGYIASFLTDAGDPNLLEIPGGNWNFETYFSSSSSGGTPTFYVELYKYDGTTFTLIASNSGSPEFIAFGTTLTAYFSTLAVPKTTLALTDRLAVRYYVTHSGRTITLHTEDNHLCQIITTFTTGLTALNGLTAQVQNFATGTSGTDFAISSATATHTFNLPTASATNRGALSSADWTTFNNKTSNLGTVTSVGLSSATSGVTIGSTPVTTSGTITLAIATASGSQNGLLSSTDWTTFNSKQNALTNPVTGTGTTNYLPKFTGASTIGNSTLQEVSGNLGLGVNPSSWSQFKSLEIGTTGNGISGFIGASSTVIHSNAYWNGTNWIYANTANSAQIEIQGGNIIAFKQAASGTAGNVITYTQPITLFSGGNLLLSNGAISDNGSKLQVVGSATFSGDINPTSNNSSLVWSGSGNKVSLNAINGVLDVYTGTTSYIKALTIASTGAATFSSTLRATEITASMPSGNGALYINNSSLTNKNWTFIPQTSSGETDLLLFYTGASAGTRLTVTNSGNVGIGTTSPSYKLSVVGPNGGNAISWTDNINNTGYLGIRGGGVASIGADNNLVFETVAVERMRITSSGNIGIGTTSPDDILQVNQSSTSTGTGIVGPNGLTLRNTDSTAGNYTTIQNRDSNNAQNSQIQFINVTHGVPFQGAIGFTTRASTGDFAERMRITSNGNVLIGTTTDTGGVRLQVAPSASSWISGTFAGTGGTNKVVIGNYEGAASIGAHSGALDAWANLAINFGGGNVLIGTTTNGASKLRIVGLPTSSVGLSSGDVYNLAGTLMIA